MLQGQRMVTKWRADYLILHVFITSALPFASFVHLKKRKNNLRSVCSNLFPHKAAVALSLRLQWK